MNERITPSDARGRPQDNDTGSADNSRSPASVLLVTGMSGAGKSTALKALEDLGYEAIDNLPLSLLGSMVRPGDGLDRPLAIGVDIRTRDFEVAPFIRQVEDMMERSERDVRLLFLDCDDEVLRRRFTETRRRHPLANDRPVTDGIRLERQHLARLRDQADPVIDTSDFTAADLGRWIKDHFGLDRRQGLAIFVTSFAYGRGLPREADLVFDVRFLRNPHYDEALRALDGRDPAVGAYVAADPGFDPFFEKLTEFLLPLLDRYEREGKSYLTIAVGCTGGRHRSVFVAQRLAAALAQVGRRVSVTHRDVGHD